MIEITAIHVVFFKKHKFKVPEYPFKENENTLKNIQTIFPTLCAPAPTEL